MFENYFSVIVNNLCHNINDTDKNIIFVKHFNNLIIEENDIKQHLDNYKDCSLLFYSFDSSVIQDAYSPWISWIRSLYNSHFSNMTPEEFIENCDVYYSLKNMIIGYIKDGTLIRDEDILIPNISFEHKMIIKSIANIMFYISDNISLFLVLNDLHLAPYSSIELINYMYFEAQHPAITLLTTYNDVYTSPQYIKSVWKTLVNNVTKGNYMFEYAMHSKQHSPKITSVYIPYESTIESDFSKIMSQVFTLALDESIYYCEIIYSSLLNKTLHLDNNLACKFYELFVYASVCAGNYTYALHLCETINTLVNLKDNPHIEFEYNYLLGLAHIYMSQYNLASLNIKLCKNIALDLDDDFLSFKSNLLSCINSFEGWMDVFVMLGSPNYNIEQRFLFQLDKYKYMLHKGYVLCFAFENDESYFRYSKDILSKMSSFNQGIEIAKKLDNETLIISAYNKCVILASSHGYAQTVDYFYNLSLDFIKTHPNPHEEANIYSGLGYTQIISENFNNANTYINKAIDYFYTIKDSLAIAECIYNMSINAFMSNNYELSSTLMLGTIKILQNLNVCKLRVCNISKLYGLIALSNYYLGRQYNCMSYLNLMKRIINHLIDNRDEDLFDPWDEDLFLYYYIVGLLNMDDHEYDKALYNFKRARYHMDRYNGILFLGYTVYSISLYKLYMNLNRPEDAEKAILECIDYSSKKGYSYKTDCLYAVMEDRTISAPKLKNHLINHTLDDLIEQSRMTGLWQETVNNSQDLSFIVMWQELLSKDTYQNEDEIIKTATSTLHNYFGVDKILMIDVRDNIPIVRHSDNYVGFNSDSLNKVVEYMTSLGREFIAHRTDRSFDEHKELIELFGIDTTVSIMGIIIHDKDNTSHILISYVTMFENFTTSYVMLTERILILFKCLYVQLIDVLDRADIITTIERANQSLNTLADTDSLTKLYNRQGLSRKLNDFTNLQDLDSSLCPIIMYIDLDNFKYYNDTFGHIIGDAVLVEFSAMIINNLSYKDIAVRYGGDEFLIVLTASTIAKANSISESILQSISEDEFFLNLGITKEAIETAAQKKQKLSCSIGISAASQYNADSILDAINRADLALYSIKKNGKSDYKVWTE